LLQLRVEAYARLADQALAKSDPDAAIAAAERALALDPGREVVWRLLMRAHEANGDRAAALRAFDRCRTALTRDLGTDPLPETLALHQRLLQGQGTPVPASQAAHRAERPERAPLAWLYRLATIGIVLWVLVTGVQLLLMLAGALQGNLMTAADPGAEALPFFLSHPAALGGLRQRIASVVPIGIALLPAYLAWFAALRAAPNAGAPDSPPDPMAQAGAWFGAGLGVLDVLALTVSRALGLAQMTVLPPTYASAGASQRATLVTVWDVLRQLAGTFGLLSALAHPLAVACLCLATLAAVRAGERPMAWAKPLAWSGLIVVVLIAAYSLLPLGGWSLGLGLVLAVANSLWLLALAAALWR
jgi:hypothetical protein